MTIRELFNWFLPRNWMEIAVDLHAYVLETTHDAHDARKKIQDNNFIFTTALSKPDLTKAERWEKLALTFYSHIVSRGEGAKRVLEGFKLEVNK